MSFYIMIAIMLGAGCAGGVINFLLPGNNPEPGKFLKPLYQCVLLGLGATLLVPLFLEIAQSTLMNNIRFNNGWSALPGIQPLPDTVKITTVMDSAGIARQLDTVLVKSGPGLLVPDQTDAGKNYFLWAAYCLLAAAAGFRFINMLINNVVKEEAFNKVKNEKDELEKEQQKRISNSQISQVKEDQSLRETITKDAITALQQAGPAAQQVPLPVLPVLPPITHPDDPQKGRFGGRATRQERMLSAAVSESNIPNFYSVVLTVESMNPANPLNTAVIFYIHDSFSPSVFTYTPDEFVHGKAIEKDILSYGAFTVGVITDGGQTLLELDLADLKDAPTKFRER